MSRFEKLSHVIWHCQYHIVWVPKYRFRVLKGEIAREVQNCVLIWQDFSGQIITRLYDLLFHSPKASDNRSLSGVSDDCRTPQYIQIYLA